MPRKPLLRTNIYPYHVFARSNNKEFFDAPLPLVWNIMCEKLQKVTDDYNANIQAFVLMRNHIHMLIRTPDFNIDKIMNYWMRESSKGIAKNVSRINHIFGGPYKWCLIEKPLYLAHAYRYIYQNPISARISPNVQSYPFSTAQFIASPYIAPFKIYDQEMHRRPIIPDNINNRLTWLNDTYTNDQRELLRKALRRKTFNLTHSHHHKNTINSLLSI